MTRIQLAKSMSIFSAILESAWNGLVSKAVGVESSIVASGTGLFVAKLMRSPAE